MSTDYQHFLEDKIARAIDNGFIIEPGDINPMLKPHQRDIVKWAVQGGQRAIFAAFGLGKTIMQLEIVRLTLAHAGGRGLIVCPLGVRHEFKHDAELLGLDITFVRRTDEVTDDTGLWLTNYESIRDGRLDPALEHIPAQGDRGKVIAFYAIAGLTTGARQFEAFTPEQIKRLRGGRVGPSGVHP